MKRFLIEVRWLCDGVEQLNTLPIYASSDVNAINIARTKIHRAASAMNSSATILQETVKE